MSSLWVILCAQEVSVDYPIVRKIKDFTAVMVTNWNVYEVLHEVPFMVVGQDARDVPVSRCEGLKDVCTRVRLKQTNTSNISGSNHKSYSERVTW